MRILVVEDEKKVASFIKKGLEEEYFTVDVAYNGKEGLEFATREEYDILLLDVMIPYIDGITLTKELRKRKITTPVLLLTVKDSTQAKVEGLDAGADDYLTKPFAFEEFLARIRVLLRRKNNRKNTVLKIEDLQLDQITHRVIRGGKEIVLTSKEYALLEYLMLNVNQVITRTMISEHVWDEDFDTFTNVIDVYINYLRKKIDKEFKKKLIHTLRGTGYILKGDYEV
jgi:heavy metal response regulator